MAFTATINTITPTSNDGISLSFIVVVTFADSSSGFSTAKTYNFPIATTQTTAVNTITADGTAMKSALASVSNLTQKIGTVLVL